ncbi:MAG: NAD/NADP octopine/nopaline dehydrogenase family protein [Candidatus Nanopelagicales bacterium]|jgi:opine dehydrogenase|nr:NAD/NADP octopine/nopaline dehydrogenase family protein [Candidatus Nanopelagicales bacterium]
MKIAVLGSGNGGLAMAFEWSRAGHEVVLFDFDEFAGNIAAVAQRGGITSDGEMTGFAPVAYSGHDIAQAMSGADLVFAVGPAYSTAPFAQACRPHVRPGQIFVVCPGSCAGAIVFRQTLGVDDDSVVVAETSTLPYAVRVTGEAHLTVYNRLKGGYYVAAIPASATPEVYELLHTVHEGIAPAESIWQTTLQNSNPIIHPAVSLCNAGLIERTGGDFLFYEEGVTEAVGRLIKAVDLERVRIAEALGVTVLRDPVLGIAQGYQVIDDYGIGYSQAPGFQGIRAQGQLDHRYFNEDAGYGLVFMTDLARQVGVRTPVMESLLTLSAVVTGRDYAQEAARTMAGLGLAGRSVAELREFA